LDRVGAPIVDHVTFRFVGDDVVDLTDVAADLVRYVRSEAKARRTLIRARPHRSYSGAVTVRLYWQGDRFHTVKIASTADGRLLVSHSGRGGRDLSLMLHDWLAASDHCSDICWRTRDEWNNGDRGRDAPA
jgi:hypothetical protein